MAEPGGLDSLLAGFAAALEQALLRDDQEDAERVARDALTPGCRRP